MDLFIITYSSPQASFERDSFVGSITLDKQDIGHHHNFIRFLQYAVALRANILPLTWEPGLGAVGSDGATGRVNQSLLNVQTSFAYKRFKPDVTNSQLSESQFREQQYAAMINEMCILSQPAIGGHNSFPHFVGVCFEHSPNATEFWPVLVMVKAERGDLEEYMSQEHAIGPQVSLRICGEIANGIHAVHKYGIVHGDIKPKNILIWQEYQTGGMALILADFGFSKFGAKDELIKLSRSEPWDAPEWHPRYFMLGDAMKADIYSFGLVCLWMFFRNETLAEFGLPLTTIENAFMGTDPDAVSLFQSKKTKDDSILQLSLHFLDQSIDLDDDIRSRLRTVFTLALANDPGNRPASMEIFVKTLLGSSEELLGIDSLNKMIAPDWHGSLDAVDFLFRLDFCDYRLHSFVVDALIRMTNDEGCDCCGVQAAFQLSLCCSVGFGTCVSSDTEEWLQRSNRSMSDLASVFDRLSGSRLDATYLEDLSKLGYRHDLTSQYISDGILDDALEYYRHSVVAREKFVGPNHPLTHRAKHILIQVLMKKGKLEEAWEVAVTLTKLADLSEADRVTVNATLAHIWMAVGDTVRAEAAIRSLLEWCSGEPEQDHAERLDHQQDLVKLLLQRGEYDEALELALETVEGCIRFLGSNHPSTRGAKRCLAASYDALGQFQLGVEVNEDLTRKSHGAVSDDEITPVLVQDIARLGIEYHLLGREDAAKECYERIKNAVEGSNEMAAHAVNAVNNCATRLLIRGDLDKAATILEALLHESSRVLGVESQETAVVMGNLTYIYHSQTELDKAEKLERQVVQVRRLILGEKHADTVTAMGNLRQTLLAQKRNKEAADIAHEEYACFQNASREEKMNAAKTLARALESAGASAEAIPFFEEEITLNTTEAEDSPLAAVSAMILMASCHTQLGQLSLAQNLVDEVVLRLQAVTGLDEDSTTIAADMIRLTHVFLEKNCISEAEQLLSITAGRFRQLLEHGDLTAQFESVSAKLTRELASLRSSSDPK